MSTEQVFCHPCVCGFASGLFAGHAPTCPLKAPIHYASPSTSGSHEWREGYRQGFADGLQEAAKRGGQ